MILKTLLLMILSISVYSQCTDGCLKCIQKTCQYCDLQNGFRLVGQKCEKFTLENCEFANNLGTCLKCSKDFHLDLSTKKCIKILSQNLIENCSTYNSPNSCSYCKTGFYLENGKCIQISSPIQNCLMENSQQICLQCKPSYVLDIEQKNCIVDPKESNCATYKNVQCDSCKPGYIYNPNSYLSNLLTLATSLQQQDFLYYNDNLANNVIDTKKFSTCVQVKVQNCSKFLNFDFCEQCLDGYFLTRDGQCQENPKDAILNCEQYNSLNSCSRCEQGYWLTDKNICQQVKPIRFCSIYASEPMKSNCIRCEETHFLIGLNNCVPRDKIEIENCVKLNANSETCELCLNTFRLTDDKTQCLQIINDCDVYEPSNYLTHELKCKICSNGFYYNQNERFCVSGDKEFCKVYQLTNSLCEICDNKYYLQNGNCLPHDVIPSCEVYHPLIKNVCFKCNYETFLFHKINSCEMTQDIPNCQIYKNINTCVQCQDNYYLQDNTCILIPAAENCVRRSGQQCGKCLKDFVLENGICRDPLDYIVNECGQDNIDGTTDYQKQKCFYCKDQRVPFNYKDTFVCVENDFMKLQQNVTSLDTQCLQYISDKNYNYQCVKCQFPYVILNGKCVENCPPTHTLYKQILKQYNADADRINESFQIDRVNQCGELIPYCKIAAPDLNQFNPDRVTYTCIECDTNSLPLIEFSIQQNRVLIDSPHDKDVQYGKSPVSYNPPTTCVPSQQVTVIGEVNNLNMVDNCQYYQNLGLVKGCIKCHHGYTGVVLDLVNQCEIYTNDQYTCKKCKQNFYLASPYECKPVKEVLNCLNYSQTSNTTKCIQCQTGYYVSSDTFCSLRQLSRDKSNCDPISNSDACTCQQNYFNSNTNGGYNCEQKPSYCITATKVNNVIGCTVCDDTKSFKQGSVCVAGSINKCIQYKQDQSYCLKCDNNYFVNDGVCVQHSTLNQCDIYSQTNKNSCSQCNIFSILFNYKTRCVQFDSISNCEEYDSNTTCKKCVEGYRLENLRKRCLEIQQDQNCKIQLPVDIYNSDNVSKIDTFDAMNSTTFIYTCDKCSLNYLKLNKKETFTTSVQIEVNGVQVPHPKSGQQFDTQVCINYQKSILENCHESVIDGKKEFENNKNNGECKQCKQNSQLEDFADDKYICLDQSYFDIIQSDLDITNCETLHYEKINGQLRYVCNKCKYGFYQEVNNPNGTNICTNTCTTNNTTKVIGFLNKDNQNVWSFHNDDRKCASTSNTDLPVHNTDPSANAVTDLITNCEIYSRYLGLNNKLTCVKCKSGYLPVMQFTDSITTLINENGNIQDNPFGVQLGFSQCVKKGDSNYSQIGTFTSHEVANCKYYGVNISATDNIKSIYCFRCSLGYNGPIKTHQPEQNDATTKFGYIESCSDMTSCDKQNALNSIETYGIGLQHSSADFNNGNLMKYFSCYKCTSLEEIPILHVKVDSTTGKIDSYLQYDPKPDFPTATKYATETPANNNHGYSVDCRKVYKTNGTEVVTDINDISSIYKVQFGDTTKILTLNCAIGIINTNDNGDNANATSNTWGKKIGCLACKPGYAPTQGTAAVANTPQPIDTCEKIENCTNAGSYINGCEQCIHYYDYTNTTGSAINYSKCVPERVNDGVTYTKCFAAYDVGKCQVCQPGYTKNQQGMCESLQANFCTSDFYTHDQSSLNLFNGKLITPAPLMMYLLRHHNRKGCNKCIQNTEKLVRLNKVVDDRDLNLPNLICTLNTLNPLRKNYMNCERYGWDKDKQVCMQCHVDYVLTTKKECSLKCQDKDNNGQCISKIDMTNCELLNEMNGTSCLKCKVGYLVVGGLCIDKQNAVQNCKDYDEELSKFGASAVCKECTSGNHLKTPSICAQNPITNCAIYDKDNKTCQKCSNGYQKIILKNGQQQCYKVFTSNSSDNQDQCDEWDNVEFQMKNLKCLKCKINQNNNNSYLVTETDIKDKTECMKFEDKSNQDFEAQNCKKYDIDPLTDKTIPNQFQSNTFRCLECKQTQGVDIYQQFYYERSTAECKPRTPVDNCKKHAKENDECEECLDNYVLINKTCQPLVISDVNTVPKNFGYIQSCSLMSKCDNKIKYQGLNVHLQTLSSCHKCIDTTEIPFISARTSDDKNTIQSLQEYGFVQNNINKFISQSGEKAVQCLKPIKSTFNIVNDIDFNFAQNCGLGLINVKEISQNNSLNTQNEKHGIYCVACQPMYKPSLTNTLNYYVSTCAQIQNCESSTWFNSCSQCKPGYSYGYSKGVQYDECVSYSIDTNCYAVQTIDNKQKCMICRQGYVMNVDGICEGIIAPRCGYGKFDFKRNYQLHDLPIQLFLQGDGPGCQQCDEGFVGIHKPQDTIACTASPYHTDNKVTSTSKYLYKCKNYKVVQQKKLECEICEENYVLGVRGDCYVNTNLQNCKLALNDSKCRLCIDGFVNIDRACIKGDIDKCKIYGNQDQSFESICVQCQEGYFLKDNKCNLGQVNNCEVFANEKNCLKCKPNFGLMKIAKGENYCFPIDDSMQCKEVSDTHLQVGLFQCKQCKNNTQVLLHDPKQIQTTTCIPFIKTENCIRYNKTDSLIQTTFDCIECSNEFYLNNNQCMQRSIMPSNCTQYSLNKDQCDKCADKYFLSEDSKNCLPYPQGTPNCQVYLTQTECLVCKNEYYLKDKQCQFIPEDRRIDNCILYEDLQICQKCQEGFLLLDGICVKANATGCSKFKTINSCASCPQGSGFVQDGNLLNCVAQSVSNCLQIDPYDPYPCLKCEDGFFLLDNKCAAVTTQIENCLTYSDNGVCDKCEVGFVLSANKSTCMQNAMLVSLLDPYCQDSKVKEQPVCNTCKFGHVFKHGYCLPCSNNTLNDGCLNCNPSNQNQCLICKQGYYQHSNGKCYKNGDLPPEEKPKNNNPEIPNDNQNNQPETNEIHKIVIGQILTYLIWIYLA